MPKQGQVMIEVYEKAPEGFVPQVEIAACYLEVDKRLLVMRRAFDKSEPGLWGVPAGKVEQGEAPEQGARRELLEETGIAAPSKLHYLGALYMRKPGVSYVYHLFKINIDQKPDVHLSDEHLEYRWVSATEIKELPLIGGAEQALHRYGWNT